MKKQHEPIIWVKENSSIEVFFQVARGLNMTHIIYVQDSEGLNKTVWATNDDDLVDCLYAFSNKCYFGRIQCIKRACAFGFNDEMFTN